MKNETSGPLVFDHQKLNIKKNVVINRVVASEELFSGARELVIKHAGENYHLRLTNQGKLILTK